LFCILVVLFCHGLFDYKLCFLKIKARTHLRVNGVTFSLYFLPILCIFCFLAICHVVMQVAIVYAFNVEAFTNVYAAMTMIILLMTCILPTLLFTAAFSYLFNKMESAQRVFFNISVIAGYFCMLLVSLLNMFIITIVIKLKLMKNFDYFIETRIGNEISSRY